MSANRTERIVRRVTLDGVLVVMAFGFVMASLISPREVAGLIWNAVLMAVNFWAVS